MLEVARHQPMSTRMYSWRGWGNIRSMQRCKSAREKKALIEAFRGGYPSGPARSCSQWPTARADLGTILSQKFGRNITSGARLSSVAHPSRRLDFIFAKGPTQSVPVGSRSDPTRWVRGT